MFQTVHKLLIWVTSKSHMADHYSTSALESMIKRYSDHLGNSLLFFLAKRNIQGGFTAYGIEIKWYVWTQKVKKLS